MKLPTASCGASGNKKRRQIILLICHELKINIKPQDDAQVLTVEVIEEQDGKIPDAENEMAEEGVGWGGRGVKPHPENTDKNSMLETGGNETISMKK